MQGVLRGIHVVLKFELADSKLGWFEPAGEGAVVLDCVVLLVGEIKRG